MPKFLKTYLIVTGIGAFIVLNNPSIVVLGAFFLVLPGLLLDFIPTAFLWGLIYAVCWYPVRTFYAGRAASALTVAMTVAVLCAVPLPSILAAHLQLALHELPNVPASAPISLHGDVRMERRYAKNCDGLCLAILFEPGVSSVTINQPQARNFAEVRDGTSAIDGYARTYRLVPKARCPAGSGSKVDPGMISGIASDRDQARMQALQWASALSSRYCLVQGAPIGTYDFLLRSGDFNAGADRKAAGPWTYPLGALSGSFAEIRTRAGRILYRRYYPGARAMAIPFSIIGGGAMTSFHFGWGKYELPKRSFAEREGARMPGFAEALAIGRGKIAPDAARLAARGALEAALDDPASTGQTPVFESVGDYLETVKQAGSRPEDAALVERLLHDPRLGLDMTGVYLIPELFRGTQLAAMKDAIIDKILASPLDASPQSGALGLVLGKWPAGAFAQTTPATEALLADPVRRRRATGLIARQSDRGAAAVPRLVEIVEYHVRAANAFQSGRQDMPSAERYGGYPAHNSATEAALSALCRLGPVARDALPRIDALTDRRPRAVSNTQWTRVLVRLGKPVSDIRKPDDVSGTADHYRRNLQRWIDGFDPDKSC